MRQIRPLVSRFEPPARRVATALALPRRTKGAHLQMNLVEWLQRIMVGFGAAWVMWLMLGLSVISVAIILERGWFFWSLRDDLVTLQRDLRNALRDSIESAKKRMEASPSAEAAVVLAGLAEAQNG